MSVQALLSDTTISRVRDQFLSGRPASGRPMLYAMAGIPGAGKSTFVDRAVKDGLFPADAFILDPDRVMQALPEYQADFERHGAEHAFHEWEMAARDLAYAMLQTAVDFRMNIIKDMGCARMENFEKLRAIKSAGYGLKMFFIPCPVDVALERTAARPRHTPQELVIERARSLENLLPLYRDLADEFILVGAHAA